MWSLAQMTWTLEKWVLSFGLDFKSKLWGEIIFFQVHKLNNLLIKGQMQNTKLWIYLILN